MKKFKFEEPFAAFNVERNKYLSNKERWRIALHDPAYLFIVGLSTIYLIGVLIVFIFLCIF
jgi:hypothetical protein